MKNENIGSTFSDENKKLTIAMFTDTYPPDINGVAIAVQTLKKSLESMGHTVYVVTPTEQTTFHGHICVDNDNVIRIPGIKLQKLYGYRLSRPISIAAYKLLGRLGIDICHVHTEFSMRFIATPFANGKKLPLIYTYHTMYEDYTHYITKGYGDNFARRLVRWLSWLYAHGTSAVIAPTSKTRDALLGYSIKNDIHIVPSGINTAAIKEGASDTAAVDALRKKYGLKGFVLVYLGRLAEEKNVDMLLGAMTGLEQATLLVVGYGPDEERLKRKAAELGVDGRTIFTGKVPHDSIAEYYALGDVFVSASTSETQGLTYIEAMAAGLPVIAHSDRCLDGVITPGVNGFLFDDADGLDKAVADYAALSDKGKALMKKEAESVAEGYSYEKTAQRILNVYEKYLSDNK